MAKKYLNLPADEINSRLALVKDLEKNKADKNDLDTLSQEIDNLQKQIIAMRGDNDTTEVIDTFKEVIQAMPNMKRGDTIEKVATTAATEAVSGKVEDETLIWTIQDKEL